MGDRSISPIVLKNLVKSKYSNTDMRPGRKWGEGKRREITRETGSFLGMKNPKLRWCSPETEVVFARN
jgi:hypothetical protein